MFYSSSGETHLQGVTSWPIHDASPFAVCRWMWLWCQVNNMKSLYVFFKTKLMTRFTHHPLLWELSSPVFFHALELTPTRQKPLKMEGFVWDPAIYKTSKNPGGDRNPSPRTSEPKPSKSGLTTQVATWVSAGHQIFVWSKVNQKKTYRKVTGFEGLCFLVSLLLHCFLLCLC